MGRIIRIVGWNERFENRESRRYKRLKWVAMPTDHGGRGYRRLMRRPGGAELYGAWCLLVQVAARLPERDGSLVDDHGPLTFEDLEDLTECPAAVFQAMIEATSEPRIGWTTYGADVAQTGRKPGADLAQTAPGTCAIPGAETVKPAPHLRKPGPLHKQSKANQTAPNQTAAAPDIDKAAGLLAAAGATRWQMEAKKALQTLGMKNAAIGKLLNLPGTTAEAVQVSFALLAKRKPGNPAGFIKECLEKGWWKEEKETAERNAAERKAAKERSKQIEAGEAAEQAASEEAREKEIRAWADEYFREHEFAALYSEVAADKYRSALCRKIEEVGKDPRRNVAVLLWCREIVQAREAG